MPLQIPARIVAKKPSRQGQILAVCLGILVSAGTFAAPKKAAEDLWALKPVIRPEIPTGLTSSTNPIDAFIAEQYRAKELKPAGAADRRTLLRRVYLDLIGIPPTPSEQESFLADDSPDAYERVVDRLLSSEQHAVRYARHWLDIMRYADTDERMVAAPGIYLWRDWVIRALHEDVPYDQFVRCQLTGYRSTGRTSMSATGFRSRTEPRPDDLFALGFLARGAAGGSGSQTQELAIAAVETVSTAFMGMTVGCAKCHDHMYDPIKKRDFYAMKALFDPLIPRKITLAAAADIVAAGKSRAEAENKRALLARPLDELTAPYKKRLYDDRVAMLPPDVQTVIRKSESERSAQEQKIADDYFPILRIDAEKIVEVLPQPEKDRYQELKKNLDAVAAGGPALPVFWTVEADRAREQDKSYILTSGDPDRPEKNHEVEPGWPFAPAKVEFRDGRIEAFSDWLTTPDNPLFARVAVNRLWQWHFGEGIKKVPSDFGELGGVPANPKLLDWMASEFVRRGYSMKEMHKLIVTSDAYQLASSASQDIATHDGKIDPTDAWLWRFRLQRLEAEPIWDSILAAAGSLDLAVGGPSFDIGSPSGKRRKSGAPDDSNAAKHPNRRAAYMTRGFSTSRDATPNFLQSFDVDDGRAPCPMRTQTVTAPQSLFMMNSPEIDRASTQFAERINRESDGDLKAAVDKAYEVAIARPPSAAERERALAYLENDPAKLKGLAWLLLNLDEFVYAR